MSNHSDFTDWQKITDTLKAVQRAAQCARVTKGIVQDMMREADLNALLDDDRDVALKLRETIERAEAMLRDALSVFRSAADVIEAELSKVLREKEDEQEED